MNLLTVLATILAVSSAGQIYNNPPSSSFLDYQQSHHYQPEGFTAQTHQIQTQDLHSHIISQPDHSTQQQFVSQLQSAMPQQDTAIQSHAPVASPPNLMHQSGMPFQYTNFDQNQYHQQNNFADISYQGLQAQHNQVPDYSGRQTRDGRARILNYQFDHDGHNYQYAYETENGIKAQEAGTAIKGTAATGGYSYTGDDGKVYSVTYTADENGFRASGAHLPTPPPIPKEIAEALEKNARDEANGINDEGQYIQEKQDVQVPEYQQEENVHEILESTYPNPQPMRDSHK